MVTLVILINAKCVLKMWLVFLKIQTSLSIPWVPLHETYTSLCYHLKPKEIVTLPHIRNSFTCFVGPSAICTLYVSKPVLTLWKVSGRILDFPRFQAPAKNLRQP